MRRETRKVVLVGKVVDDGADGWALSYANAFEKQMHHISNEMEWWEGRDVRITIEDVEPESRE